MKTDYERFSSKYRIEGDCWIWIGAKKHERYGCMRFEGRTHSAHRVAYRIFKGSIPDGYEVCHTCDNGFCVNPDHLFLGTHKDNMTDCAIKGRLVSGGRKFTKEDVLNILDRVKSGESQRSVARGLNTSSGVISKMVRGLTWGHVSRI